MPVERVVWTALPYQFDAEHRLRLSLHVAPRVTNNDGSDARLRLGECPAFVDWPARLRRLRFRVEFEGVAAAPAIVEAEAESALWVRLFPPGTRLQPFVFKDNAARDLHVFPVREVHAFLRDAYGTAAADGIHPPSIDDAFGPLARFAPLEHLTVGYHDRGSFYGEMARARQAVRNDGRVVREHVADAQLPPAEQAAQNAFFEAFRFYNRPGSIRPDLPAERVEPSPEIPRWDFHQRVGLLGDHPDLLRRLGLVVDIAAVIDPSAVPPSGRVRIVPDGELPETPPMCPWTSYERDDRWFGARPRSRDRMHRGLLDLRPEHWDLFQVDVDGAALKTLGFAETLASLREPGARNHETPGAAAVPALRSAGLSLARVRRAELLLEDLRDRRRKNEQIEAGEPPSFDAEHLVRGYRVDVRDADAAGGARWFSLQQRRVEHRLPGAGPDLPPLTIPARDEGYVKAASAASERADHPTPSDDLYLHETTFGWEGWSLAAPMPGLRIVEPRRGDDGTDIAREDPGIGNPPLVSRIEVEPRSLPRLRVGRRYRLRARTVDIAGNSRAFTPDELEPNEPTLASVERPYLRFDPVPSPTVLRRHLDTEGESLEHLVIRSDVGLNAAEYAASRHVRAALEASGASHVYAAASERHLAPPKASVQMAEQAGLLDGGFAGDPAAATGALRVALREEGTFLDPLVVDVQTGRKTIAQSTIRVVPVGTPLPANHGDALPGGAYVSYPDEGVVLPYLPDPLAIGVSLTAYRSGEVVFHQVARFANDWPGLVPLRLRLAEGPLGVSFGEGVLEVRLPPSEVVQARLASVFPGERLGDFAMWHWVPEAARTRELERAALEGRHYMLTPFRWLTLTHAVQRPLGVPDMKRVQAVRSAGRTCAEFQGTIASHAASTGRLDVWAEWTEDVDVVTEELPRTRALGTALFQRAHAFGFDVEPAEDQAELSKPGRLARHELGDTKYRRIAYHSVATSRFRNFLPPPIAGDDASIQRVEPASDASGAADAALVRDVLSSARPAAPEVAYVLPTFRWERQEAPTRRHVRRGGAVRVWLRRPWFSSGDGEQLAVVLAPGVRLPHGWEYLHGPEPSPAAPPAPLLVSLLALDPAALGSSAGAPPTSLTTVSGAILGTAGAFAGAATGGPGASLARQPSAEEIDRMLAPYVTQWGLDPVWKSALPPRPPTAADFPRNVGVVSGLALDEIPDVARVVAALHDVAFDRQRKLWYCDIEIDLGGSYFPFVRLALARYQGHSVPGAHLSRVTLTDFIQLAPDRNTEVTLTDVQAAVTVRGYSGRNHVADLDRAAADRPNTTVRAALQRRTPGVPGDLGWETVGTEVTLSPATDGFLVTWSGSLPGPDGGAPGEHRLLVTESETFLRTDPVRGDPGVRMSPTDFLRERVVYADAFALGGDTESFSFPEAQTSDPAFDPVPDPPLPPVFDYGSLPMLAPGAAPAVDAYVKLAQAMLNSAVAGPPHAVDGVFGPLMTAVVQAFQSVRQLPATGVLDTGTWFALALASPYPLLEPGLGDPPMAGPPVALLQRLLDQAGVPPRSGIDGSFTPETQSRLESFQAQEGLPVTGTVTRETWVALASMPARDAPAGAMRWTFSYDSEDWAAGGPPVRLVSREDIDMTAPRSEPLEPLTQPMSGFWYELHDSDGEVLYRRQRSMPIVLLVEVPAEASEPGPARFPIDAPRGTFELLAPIIPRASMLVLFSSPLDLDRLHEPASAIAAFVLGNA